MNILNTIVDGASSIAKNVLAGNTLQFSNWCTNPGNECNFKGQIIHSASFQVLLTGTAAGINIQTLAFNAFQGTFNLFQHFPHAALFQEYRLTNISFIGSVRVNVAGTITPLNELEP